MIEEYIKKYMLMEDNPGNRESFPDNHWYGEDPLRVCISHVGIHQLRLLAKEIEAREQERLKPIKEALQEFKHGLPVDNYAMVSGRKVNKLWDAIRKCGGGNE